MFPNDATDLAQYGVACITAEAFVHLLKVIQSKHRDGEWLFRALGAMQLARQRLLEEPAIDEAGRFIMSRIVNGLLRPQCGFGVLLLGPRAVRVFPLHPLGD